MWGEERLPTRPDRELEKRLHWPELGPVAQRLEQGTHNPLVVCSNHTGPTSLVILVSQYGWPSGGATSAPLEVALLAKLLANGPANTRCRMSSRATLAIGTGSIHGSRPTRGTTGWTRSRPGRMTPTEPRPRSSRAAGWRVFWTCRSFKPLRASYPWLSLRATRSKGYASWLPVGACRRTDRACIRGRKVAVAVGCGEWCGSRG
jgi:hypothetical protein